MRNCILLTLLLYSVFTKAQTVTQSIMVDGLERSYRFLVPESYNPEEPIPVVFNFHGLGSNAFEQQLYSGMNAVAEANTFIVVYPEGVANAFNVGWLAGSSADDVAFTGAMIDTLGLQYNINFRRIYSCGMSNGGFMSYNLACELGDQIAAIASVTGGMAPRYSPTCAPSRPIGVMQIHGTADDVVFIEGRTEVNDPIDTTVAFWVNSNGCTDPDTLAVEDIDMTDNTTAIRINYNNCIEGSKVSYYVIDGGGHTWPGALINIGVTNQDFNASEEIWRFFEQFELPETLVNVDYKSSPAINIFPNPASDVLRVESNIPFYSFQILDLNGRIVQSGKTTQRIELQTLSPGMYTLLLKGLNDSYKEKLIKL